MKNSLFKRFISTTVATLNLFLCSNDLVRGEDTVWLKVVSVGGPETGKTCLRRRLEGQDIDVNYMPTIGAEVVIRDIGFLQGGKKLLLVLWDTSGQERFVAVSRAYLKNALVVVLVIKFDGKDPDVEVETFKFWLNTVKIDCPKAQIIVAINKFVDSGEWKSNDEFTQVMKDIPAGDIFEINARTGDGCEDLFQRVKERALAAEPSLGPLLPLPSETSPATEKESHGGSHPLFWPVIVGSVVLIPAVFALAKRYLWQTTQHNLLPCAKAQKSASRAPLELVTRAKKLR